MLSTSGPFKPHLAAISGHRPSEFSTEALFFIFYYMQQTRAQLYAAKALKDQNWVFHTKYLLWFKPQAGSTLISSPRSKNGSNQNGSNLPSTKSNSSKNNNEGVTGDFTFFDIDEWSFRSKKGFTFESRYLIPASVPVLGSSHPVVSTSSATNSTNTHSSANGRSGQVAS